jgi:polyisoprenoid-binding protein YceI
MKRRTLVTALVAFVMLVASVAGTAAAITRYTADAAHSNISFAIPILGGLSQVRGKFTDFTVEIVYDDADVTRSSVTAVIKAASIDTGIERRDAHLRNADFFDVEKYPEITFKSTRIERRGTQLIAHGLFQMHGVAKEIALPFTINGVRKNPDGRTALGVTARATINRRDYGINFSRPNNPDFLGENVEIELNVVTNPAAVEAPPATAPAQ